MNLNRRHALQALCAACAARPAFGVAAPTAPGAGISADFDPTAAVWLSYHPGHAAMTQGLVAALHGHVKLHFLVADETAAEQVRAMPFTGLEVHLLAQAGFFLRDMAVFARDAQGRASVVDFVASQYGAAAWCLRRYALPKDRQWCSTHARTTAAERDGLDRDFAKLLNASVHASPLSLEGGGVEVNGRGLMVACEELHRSRNPGLSRAQVEGELLRLPGVRKVLWLPAGLAEDVLLRATITGPYVAWGAGGHTDEFVRFADERTVLLAWPDDADAAVHPVARLNRQRMQRNWELLNAASDARGQRLRIVKVPLPRIVQRRVVLSAQAQIDASEEWSTDYFAPQERRRVGETLWQVATASYLNFVVANGVVVLPDFVAHGTSPQRQDRVRRLFAGAFPGRRIEFVDGISAHWVGGGLHCATLNQPR